MMKFSLLFLLIACSTSKTPKNEPPTHDLVTVRTALEQAQMSYLKGCVDSFRDLGMAPSFDTCRIKAMKHRQEIDSIMEQEPH